MEQHTTREAWLEKMKEELTYRVFEPKGYRVPRNIKVTCGFPSKNALTKKNMRVGEIWSNKCSAGDVFETLIHPCKSDPVEVGAIICHEICHAVCGIEDAHRRATFGRVAKNVGLEGALTSTFAGRELEKEIISIIEIIGAYPHQRLYSLPQQKKDHCRYIKLVCPDCDFYRLISRKHTEHLPTCSCGAEMVIDPKHQNPSNEELPFHKAANT